MYSQYLVWAQAHGRYIVYDEGGEVLGAFFFLLEYQQQRSFVTSLEQLSDPLDRSDNAYLLVFYKSRAIIESP